MRWTVLVPLKALPEAKSRLAADLGGADAAHLALVAAMRADTLAAIRAAAPVARVIRVLDAPDPAGAEPQDVIQHRPGLNPGLAEADEWVRGRWPRDPVAVVLGDLPALRPAELAAALAAAAAWSRAFVADRSGHGTTLLAAAAGTALDPLFGPGSAEQHAASGAQPLTAADGLRTDVDTAADLDAAIALGVGGATRAVLGVESHRR